jgi:soluble lytic murein transglycosylase
VAARDLDDTALEWWVRAALWSGDWNQAAQAIESLSEPRRQSARWRYWAARTAEQLGDTDEARRSYESLLADDNYYSGMAAARLKRAATPHARTLPADSQALATLERVPAFERARELFLCGMRQQATAEWQFGYDSLSGEERSQSIRLAASWGWFDRAIIAATAQSVFSDYALLYPRPFSDEVSNAARRAGLPPEIVYSVVRQESLYRTGAVSTAGAMGLMQLLPDTARRTALLWKLPSPRRADLFDPSVNTSLGAAYLRSLLDQFEGQLPVALAGYNAGPNAAQRWLPPHPLDADVWIENIPYNETREYVQRVLWQRLVFSWLGEGGRAQQTDSWITSIRMPRNADPSVRVADRE